MSILTKYQTNMAMGGPNFDFRIIVQDSTFNEYIVIDNRLDATSRVMKYQQAMNLMENNEEFREKFFSVLKNGVKSTHDSSDICGEKRVGSSMPYFFEVFSITKELFASETFVFVLGEAPRLRGIQQDEM